MRTAVSTVALLCISTAAAATGAGDAEATAALEQPAPQPLEQPRGPPKPPPEMKNEGLVAGWNGEHFFIQTPDGNFTLQPYGYVQLDYRAYFGEGVPADTFAIRRARFGFMGSYDKYYEFQFLADFADTNSTLVRDFFLNVSYIPELQLTVGQFVEPFAQEHCISAEFNDFVERGFTFLLYPSPTTCRSPGVMLHGDLAQGVVSYWAGVFNGRGLLALNTTSEPEVIGRLRIYPFRGGSNDWLKGLQFGGSVGHSRLSNEKSFNALVPDRSFTLIPQIPVNGPAVRLSGELTWIVGPAALRAEYVELHQSRRSLDVGQTDLPKMLARAVTVDVTCLITGEQRPEYGQPKPLRPFLTPQRDVGTGAIELKARYSYIWAQALGDPVNGFPTIQNSAHEVSFGINWYPSYLVRYMLDLNIYKVNDGATAGAALPQTFPVLLQRFQLRM